MGSKKRKFENVDFRTVEPVLHSTESQPRGFRCARSEFATYLCGTLVKREMMAYLAQCWVLKSEDGVGGYITLLSDKLTTADSRALLKNEEIKRKSFPAVKIGLLALDERVSNRGVGKRLIEWTIALVLDSIAPNVGVRFITVDALYDKDNGYDASGFYYKHGFVYANPEEELPPREGYRTMYLDLSAYLGG